ncbi:hypothetical protein EYC59_01080 [Candidatus Saccharibacteria bacterium]|nr:MAG: hypothetical protein EYC59_01080 [Candidatus Saccharibacteria bacterium]
MDYKGTIIEESLSRKTVLKQLNIVATKVEPVTEAHKTPWLTHWTLHAVVIPTEKAEAVAKQLSKSLEGNYWYVDFKNDTTHYVIFPGRVFRVNRSRPDEYQAAIAHGHSLGIPEYQLDFSPN